MPDLTQLKCVACRGGEPVVTAAEMEAYKPQIPEWQIVEENGVQHLRRTFKFRNFIEALQFTERVGAIAEAEGHHPLLVTEWGRVTVDWWTHVIKGLHRNDFIMAAKTDQLFGKITTAA